MTREEIAQFYTTYKNLYAAPITASIVDGGQVAPEWCILETVPPPPPELDPVINSSKILGHNAGDKAIPLVFKVLAVGAECTRVKRGDFVLTTFLAGDKASQTITLVREKDIYFVYGDGLRLTEDELDGIGKRLAALSKPVQPKAKEPLFK